ncbi:MAG: tetratricopeptide repeat protein [Buchnera aphidicola (Nurudea shiraii)]
MKDLNMFLKKDIKKNYNLNKTQKNIIFLFLALFAFLFFKFYLNVNIDVKNYDKLIQEVKINKDISIKKIIEFIKNNENNIYGTFASLYLSKTYFEKNLLYNALLILQNNLKYIHDEHILNIVILNMSKIHLQLNNYKKSLKLINNINLKSWKSIKHDLKGNVFFLLNNTEQAILEWKKSIYYQIREELKEIVQMKLNNIK